MGTKKKITIAAAAGRMGSIIDQMAPLKAKLDVLCAEMKAAKLDPNRLERELRAARAVSYKAVSERDDYRKAAAG